MTIANKMCSPNGEVDFVLFIHMYMFQSGETALMIASFIGHHDIVQQLLKSRACLDLQKKVCVKVHLQN